MCQQQGWIPPGIRRAGLTRPAGCSAWQELKLTSLELLEFMLYRDAPHHRTVAAVRALLAFGSRILHPGLRGHLDGPGPDVIVD